MASSTSTRSLQGRSANVALQKHAKFWDRKNKGYITPVDAIAGLMNLGYNLFFSVTIGAFLTIVFSYATQDSWLPDPFCRVDVKGMLQKSGDDDSVYDEEGHFDSDKFEVAFNKYAKADLSGKTITIKELVEMSKHDSQLGKDPMAWSNAALRWCTAYFFIGHNGIMTKDNVRAAYDGSLFFRLRDAQRPMIEQKNARKEDNTTVTLSGVQIPRSAIRSIEGHISSFSTHLPRSFTEKGVLDWLKSSLKALPSPSMAVRPTMLTGVPTPLPPRHHLFSKRTGDDQGSIQLLSSGLTGIKPLHLDTQDLTGLTGVLGHELRHNSDDLTDRFGYEGDTGNESGHYGLSGLQRTGEAVSTPLSPSLPGLRPEGEAYYQDTPNTWSPVSLTGVQRVAGEEIGSADEEEGTLEQGEEEQVPTPVRISGVLDKDEENEPKDNEEKENEPKDKEDEDEENEPKDKEEEKERPREGSPDFGSDNGTTCSDDGSSPKSPVSLTMEDREGTSSGTKTDTKSKEGSGTIDPATQTTWPIYAETWSTNK